LTVEQHEPNVRIPTRRRSQGRAFTVGASAPSRRACARPRRALLKATAAPPLGQRCASGWPHCNQRLHSLSDGWCGCTLFDPPPSVSVEARPAHRQAQSAPCLRGRACRRAAPELLACLCSARRLCVNLCRAGATRSASVLPHVAGAMTSCPAATLPCKPDHTRAAGEAHPDQIMMRFRKPSPSQDKRQRTKTTGAW